MEKLDRLGWTDGLSFTAYGNRFGLRANDAEVLRRARQLVPPGAVVDSSPVVDFLYSLRVGGQDQRRPRLRQYHLLYTGSSLLTRSMELDATLERLASHLELLTAYAAKGFLFVHAGAVGWRGQAIVLPGRSRSGKTSLVAALLEAGATYYSDEFAVFDAEGRLHPYPRPLGIRQPGGGAAKVPAEELGGTVGKEPLPVGLVAVTEYDQGARWRPRRLSPARTLLALMDNTVAARRSPEISMSILGRVVTRAGAVKSKRGEARQAADVLLRQLAGA